VYYIDPDGKTVHEARITKRGIELANGQEVLDADCGSRIFAVHPRHNTFMQQEPDGTWSFCDPNSKLRPGRHYFGPGR
jgi:hypothetical protein